MNAIAPIRKKMSVQGRYSMKQLVKGKGFYVLKKKRKKSMQRRASSPKSKKKMTIRAEESTANPLSEGGRGGGEEG